MEDATIASLLCTPTYTLSLSLTESGIRCALSLSLLPLFAAVAAVTSGVVTRLVLCIHDQL